MRRLFVFVALLATTCCAFAQGFSRVSPEQQAKDKAKLSKLEKAYVATKAAFAKKPKDKKARESFVVAATKFGHESMVSDALSARVKYKQALRVYREVLKLDPNNPVAKPESELIVRIYKSMGRPIPK